MEQALKQIVDISKEFGIACAAALQFLTIAYPFIRRPFTGKEMGQAVGCFPLVGLLLGAVLALLDIALRALFGGAHGALLLVFWVVLTGALHVDGFIDSCDGLFGGKTTDERLSIMKDPRVGAFGVVGGVLLLLTKYSALESLRYPVAAVLLAPMLARWSMAYCVVGFPYARAEGLGRTMKDNASWTDFALATIFVGLATLVIALCSRNILVLLAPGIVLLATWLITKFVMKRLPGLSVSADPDFRHSIVAAQNVNRLPGLTGDIYGAVCETIEALVLCCF